MELHQEKAIIYTDGACSGNPGPGGWGAIIAFPNSEDSGMRIVELGGKKNLTTNNQMELSAILFALEFLGAQLDQLPKTNFSQIQVITDSQYVISGITEWRKQWKTRAWTNQSGAPIANQQEWMQLEKSLEYFSSLPIKIEYTHIPGHSHIPANERCDAIAQAFSQNKNPILFSGPQTNYTISLSLPANFKERAEWRSKIKKGAGYYLSYVDGKIARHTTWAECEALVKGRANAKFQKCVSAEQEEEILGRWGITK